MREQEKKNKAKKKYCVLQMELNGYWVTCRAFATGLVCLHLIMYKSIDWEGTRNSHESHLWYSKHFSNGRIKELILILSLSYLYEPLTKCARVKTKQ